MTRGHRHIDHTADIALALWAPTEEELLLEGASAIVAVITEGASVEHNALREVEVSSIDGADRLVQWLNEVLVLAITDGFLFADAELTLRPDGLHAKVVGETGDASRIRTELKSVTYHDLVLERDETGGFVAQVVVDV